jgi:predicted esterase
MTRGIYNKPKLRQGMNFTRLIAGGVVGLSALLPAQVHSGQEWHETILWSALEAVEDSVEGAFEDDEEYFHANLDKIAPGYEKSVDGMKLPYRLFTPRDYDASKSYPLVLLLHGAGSRGSDNVDNVKNGFSTFTLERNQGRQPMFVVAPQCPANAQWVNTPWEDGAYSVAQTPISAPMKVVVGILDELEKNYSIDAKRIYVTGLSMGGFGTWDLISRFPNRFAAAVPICGGGDPGKAEALKTMPIWTFHGDEDNLVPHAGTLATAQAIHDGGGVVKFTTFAGAGHLIWDGVFRTQAVVDWMLAQRLGVPVAANFLPRVAQTAPFVAPFTHAQGFYTLNGRGVVGSNGHLASQLLLLSTQPTSGVRSSAIGHIGLSGRH